MLFSFLKKRLVNTKSFITVLIILNICFAFLLGISFTSVKSKISYERGQSVEALYLSAESNIKLVLEQIRLLGDDASEKLPDFADTSDSFKLNMSEYLKRLDCLYDIIYIYEDDIYSCGKLLTEETAKLSKIDKNATCAAVSTNNKELIAFSNAVYSSDYQEAGKLYLIIDRNKFLKQFDNNFYSFNLFCEKTAIVEQKSSANNNAVTAEIQDLPYMLTAEITVFPETFKNFGFVAIIVFLVFLIAIIVLDCILINYYNSKNAWIINIKNNVNNYLEGKGCPIDNTNISDSDLNQLASVIALLEKHTDDVTEQLNSYKQTVYEQELTQSKLKYFALKNQINPHFLYNTLACIKSIAICNREKEIAEISSGMAKILKYNLSSENTATVAQEVAMIEAYLYIQSIRYYNSFSYNVSVDESIMNFTIMRFFLQPIVENAVIHGFSNNFLKGTINISGFRQDDCVVFKIEDTGIGIPPNILIQIKKELENAAVKLKNSSDETTNGIGLSNINSRIALFYGEDYGITINSAVNNGTIVTVKLPIDKRDTIVE